MFIFCASSVAGAAIGMLGSTAAKSTYHVAPVSYNGTTEMTHYDLIASMKNMRYTSNYIIDFIQILVIGIFISSDLPVRKLIYDGWGNDTTILALSFIKRMLLSVIFFPIVFPGTVSRTSAFHVNMDDIIAHYLKFYEQHLIPISYLLDYMSLYVKNDPFYDIHNKLFLAMILILTCLLIYIFLEPDLLEFKIRPTIEMSVLSGLSVGIISLGLLLMKNIQLYLNTPGKHILKDNDISVNDVLSAENMNLGFMKTKMINALKFENFVTKDHMIQSDFNRNIVNEEFVLLSTSTIVQFFKHMKWIFLYFTSIGLFVSSIESSHDISVAKKNFVICSICFCFLSCVFIGTIFQVYEDYPSIYIAVCFSLFLSAMLFVDSFRFLKSFIVKILSVILLSGSFVFVVYVLRSERKNLKDCVKFLCDEFKLMESKSVPLVNEDVLYIGDINQICFDFYRGISFGERCLIDPLWLKMDVVEKWILLKQNDVYVLPNNICKTELDNAIFRKFTSGEYDLSEPWSATKIIDGYDPKACESSYMTLRKKCMCSTICFLGRSGSGKTTFINALAGLQPEYYDCIFVTGSNGRVVNFKNLDLNKFHRMLTYLHQSPNRFIAIPISLRIIMDELEVPQSKVLELADQLELSDSLFLYSDENKKNVVNGFDESLFQLSTRASGGEMSRMCLLHILLLLENNKQNKVNNLCFFDEPNAALDQKTGEKVINIIHQYDSIRLLNMHHLKSMDGYAYLSYELVDRKFVCRYHEPEVIDE
jgi:energy-coupling factor transporter ATP-binding protein EcfA2